MNHGRMSVVATVRNERNGIRSFIESLLGQTLPPDELIIVDGGSTDGTLEILREYERGARIKLIAQPCNIAEGRNLGIAAARNELIAVTDAGCTADSTWLASIADAFDGPERPDVVAANYAFETHSDFELASVFATDPPQRETSELAKYFPSSRSVGFRKSAWAAAQGYPEWLYAAEDTLFNVRLRQLGHRFVFCRDALVRWRPRSTWKALCRQHFNYGRGNGRIGLGFTGYWNNLQHHALIALSLVVGAFWPYALLGVVWGAVQLVRRNLWRQARHAQKVSGRVKLFWLTLVVMYCVRLAGLTGFIAGRLDRLRHPRFVQEQRRWMGADTVEDLPRLPAWTSGVMLVTFPLLVAYVWWNWRWMALVPAGVATLLLALKSLKDFSRTGPQLKEEILHHYAVYSLLSFLRLCVWAFVLCFLMAGTGLMVLDGIAGVSNWDYGLLTGVTAGMAGIVVLFTLQFCSHLLHIPGSIAASSNYRLSRLYPLWAMLSPRRIRAARVVVALAVSLGVVAAAMALANAGKHDEALVHVAGLLLYMALLFAATYAREPAPVHRTRVDARTGRMNVLMLGTDTLRADRLGLEGYHRPLTPAIDALANHGTYLARCYIPCGRTAPSLASMLTGAWPHTHGIRDNFALPSEASLAVSSLPEVLAGAGYQTAAISDWAGADLGKYPFGFERRSLPSDQWNIKYLIRQGPKDLRLFLSLFTHNQFGRRFLPELYFLAGVPMTDELGRATRVAVSECARSSRPFLINAFFSTTHAPFASEYPYYTLYAGKEYAGRSKFVMGLMSDPFEIIKQQRHTAAEFDLRQIHDLYDGCVKRFDDEVARILAHLQACDLLDDTIVVIYSDHGIEFFEQDSWGQGNSVVVDGSSRIPLLICDPRYRDARRVTRVSRSIDMAPTLLDLLGIAAPASMEGESLANEVSGTEEGESDRPAFEETGIWFGRIPGLPAGHLHYPDLPDLLEVPDKAQGALSIKREYKDLVIRAKDRALRAGRWKVVYRPMESGVSRIELYDLESDPECRRDLAAAHPRVAARLAQQLIAWIPPAERQALPAWARSESTLPAILSRA